MEEEGLLRELGFTGNEAKVYLALLETGQATAGPVIKKTGLHKATTYQIFQRLAEKGLVSSVMEGKTRHFMPASPRRLLDTLQQQEERLRGALPRLEAMLRAGKEKQEVTVYAGLKGIRSALDTMLSEVGSGGTYYDFGVSGLFQEMMGGYWDSFQRLKRRNHICPYVIFSQEVKRKNTYLLENYYGRARFHPKEFPSITDTFIYKDTVALFVWTAKPPIAVMIKNADNARSYRNQFMLMWKNAERR